MPFPAFCAKVERVCEGATRWKTALGAPPSASSSSNTNTNMGGKGKEKEVQVPHLSDVAEAAAALAIGALIWTNESPSSIPSFSSSSSSLLSPSFGASGTGGGGGIGCTVTSPSGSSGTCARDGGRFGIQPIVPITVTPAPFYGGVGSVGGVGPPFGGGGAYPSFGGMSLDDGSCEMMDPDGPSSSTIGIGPTTTSTTTAAATTTAGGGGGGTHMTPLPPPDPNLPYALYRLAKLAIDMHVSRHGHAARDTAMMHAYVILGHYLLCAHPTGRGGGAGGGAEAGVPPELPGLVGAMVWEARAMGLDVDPDEFDPIETRGGAGVGVVVGGGRGVMSAGIGGSNFGSPPGSVKREDREDGGGGVESQEDWATRHGMSPFVKEVRRRLWWAVVWLDL